MMTKGLEALLFDLLNTTDYVILIFSSRFLLHRSWKADFFLREY